MNKYQKFAYWWRKITQSPLKGAQHVVWLEQGAYKSTVTSMGLSHTQAPRYSFSMGDSDEEFERILKDAEQLEDVQVVFGIEHSSKIVEPLSVFLNILHTTKDEGVFNLPIRNSRLSVTTLTSVALYQ